MNKARTLEELRNRITTAQILPLYIVQKSRFINNKEMIINEIIDFFSEELLIVRSSSNNEDTKNFSNAGKYRTIANVNKCEIAELIQSIELVFASYNQEDDENEEVLIQPMLNEMLYAGVVFTCDIDTLSPYYCINYAENSTGDEVTSGNSSDLITYLSYKDSEKAPSDQMLKKIILSCKELEKLMDNPNLDIEFGIDKTLQLFILQVRPITSKNKKSSFIDLKDSLRKLHKKLQKLSTKHPDLLGNKAIFGVMPDWNPAEIIGLRPRRLALSLYKELVTDNVWARQRRDYGYRDVTSHPLIVTLLGIPYVDIRISFNSFIPQSLNDEIANKLANYYINKLCETPIYHDKVEFNIVHSCYYINLPDKLKELLGYGFNESEIKRIEFALLQLTNNVIDIDHGLYKQDIYKVKKLEKKYDIIIESDLSLIDKIYWLVEYCKSYGTLPFAGVARAAFIGIQFLRSFLETKIITQEDYDSFLETLNTVNKQMNNDLVNVKEGITKKDEFLLKYGHIRPGTYNILSERYDEGFETYFDLSNVEKYEEKDFNFSNEQLEQMNRILMQNGIESSAENLIMFIKESIEAREYAKFIFTKSLSKILQYIEELGQKVGLTKEELSYLDVREIIDLYSTLDHRNIRDIFYDNIKNNKIFYEYAETVKLPSLILEPDDIYHFYLQKEEPNFITLKNVQAPVIKEEQIKKEKITGKIVCIQSADPGYDFIFSKNIKGLITQYGGANSHMAIRCAECGIAAVIGAGESNYLKWSKAKILEIDAANKLVNILQ